MSAIGQNLQQFKNQKSRRLNTKPLTVCLVGLFQRELFDHAVDILQLGKLDGLLEVDRVARRPRVEGEPFPGLRETRVSIPCPCQNLSYDPVAEISPSAQGR